MPIVECVPNFSEGRDPAVLEAIADGIRGVTGASLLHVDPSVSAHRTVMTFAGEPEAVLEAAFRSARTARDRIDLRAQRGVHPRLGAVDVIPFIPVSDVGMDACVDLSRRLGRRLGHELGVPTYLYEEAQPRPHRKTLAAIRAGGYDGLARRIGRPEWHPDFGPTELDPATGATVTGARFFLIAYNVNVRGTGEQAHALAQAVRTRGRTGTGADGEPVRRAGYFEAVKAIGWEIEEFDVAQVSMNLDDYRVTGMHTVYEAIRRDAGAMGVEVAGSEVVGLVPLDAVLASARHYMEDEGRMGLDERQQVELVVDRLGLSSVRPFDPDTKILEYALSRSRSSAR